MFFRAWSFIKTTVGRVVAFFVGLGAVVTFLDFFLKWGLYRWLGELIGKLFEMILREVLVSMWVLIILLLSLFSLFTLICHYVIGKINKPKMFKVDIVGVNSYGYPPNESARRTEWNFKEYKEYYFVPELVYDFRNKVSYEGYFGPYCTKCKHLLDGHGSEYENVGSKFICVKCNRKYRIPTELREHFYKRLNLYFEEEMRQGRLKGRD